VVASASNAPAGRRGSRVAKARTERLLLGAVVFLVCLGLVMVYSVSSARAVIQGGDPLGQVQRQLVYAVIGFAVLAVVARAKPEAFRRAAPVAVGASIVMLVVVLVPSVGIIVNGARRWLAFGPIQLQPSEIAKLALILWLATAIARDPRRLAQPRGLVPFVSLTGLFALLIIIEPDLGTTGTVVLTAFAMLFVAGAPTRKLGAIAGAMLGLAVLSILASPYQRARVLTFLNPWADPTGQGFQTVQAEIAIGSGGLFGRGLGNSIQKNFYLPEAHTDMIGAIIGEELGLLGLFVLLAAFVIVGIAGFRIALRARDVHQRLLATGITSLICIQAGVNIAQVFGLLPVTGVPLPFVSAGGTSLVVFLAGVGILVNISRRGKRAVSRRPAAHPQARGDRGGGDGRPRQAGPRDRRRLAS
jgi:cell division protein FtsW